MLTNAKRMSPDLRKQHITEQGLTLARNGHYLLFTRGELAAACCVTPGVITAYFGGIDNVRGAVLELAIERKVIEVIAQALVQRDPLIANINDELKQKAIKFIEG